MKYKIFLFLLPILAAVWLSLPACRKASPDPPQPPAIPYWDTLPAITQIGANTFGCLVNGEVWVPRIDVRSFDPTRHDMSASIHESNGTGGGGISGTLLDFDLKQDDFMSMGFGPTYFDTVTCYGNTVLLPKCVANFRILENGYSTDPKDSLENWVKISAIDTERNIVAGTFQFIMYKDQNKNDKVLITDGRFDMVYYQQ